MPAHYSKTKRTPDPHYTTMMSPTPHMIGGCNRNATPHLHMGSSVRFSYGEFREHYIELGDVTGDVVARLYTADYPVMKYTTATPGRAAEAELRPFLHRGMTARSLPPDDPLGRHELFSLGAYVVYPTEYRRDAKKQLFIVHPRQQNDDRLGAYFTADHFSFVVNQNGRGRQPLNLHYTTYVTAPGLSIPGRPRGFAAHEFSPLPTSFDLPTGADALRRSNILRPAMADLHGDVLATMLTSPFTVQRGGVGRVAAVARGGGRRNARRRGDAAARARDAAGGVRRFDDMWRELPIHSLLVIGILPMRDTEDDGANATVTVIVTDRFKFSTAAKRAAATFMLPAGLLHDDAEVEARVAESLASLSWESMLLQSHDA